MWSRLVCRLACVSLIACPACRPSPPAPQPARPASSSKAIADDAVPVADVERDKKPTVAGPTHPATVAPPAEPAADSLRELAGRLVVSDGAGGWRLDEAAALELEKQGPDAHTRLMPLLQDSDANVRRGAAYGLLGSFDPSNAEMAAAFLGLLDDADRAVRGIGRSAVPQMSPEHKRAAVPKLAALIDPAREDLPEVRLATVRLLGTLREEAAEAVAALERAAASDPDPRVRSACLVALAQVAPADQRAALIAPALADEQVSVRLVAAGRLRQLGEGGAPAASQLAAALEDADAEVRDTAARALAAIGEPAVDPVAKKLGSQNSEARKLALACLIKIGPAAQKALPAIEKCLDDSDVQVKQLAELAIKRIGKL